jgi:hypothetical protein
MPKVDIAGGTFEVELTNRQSFNSFVHAMFTENETKKLTDIQLEQVIRAAYPDKQFGSYPVRTLRYRFNESQFGEIATRSKSYR